MRISARIPTVARPGPRLVASLAVIMATALPLRAGSLTRNEAAQEVFEILTREGGESRTEEQVVTQLARVGSDGVPVFFAMVTGEVYATLDPEVVPKLWGADRLDTVALSTLGRLPAEDVLEHLHARTRSSSEAEVRLAAVRALGALGSAEGLDLLMELVAGFDPMLLRAQRACRNIEQALVAILEDHSAWTWIRRELDELEDAPLDFLVRGLALSGKPEGVEILLGLVGRDSELDREVLDLATDIATARPWLMRHDPRPVLSALLGSADWEVRRATAVALARLHDIDSFPRLIELLNDEQLRVRSAARWSLETMSGTSVPSTAEEWWAWHARELSWREEDWEGAVAELRSREPGRVMAGMTALARKPLWREDAVDVLTETLGTDDPEVDVAICSALREIGSRRAVPALVELLDRNEPDVSRAAWETLRSLTGKDLPIDDDGWASLLKS